MNAGSDRKLTVCFTMCPSILAANGHEIVAPLLACRFICAGFLLQ
jgi:hypothetical protein